MKNLEQSVPAAQEVFDEEVIKMDRDRAFQMLITESGAKELTEAELQARLLDFATLSSVGMEKGSEK